MPLLEDLRKLLSDDPLFSLMTLYSIENSSISAKNLMSWFMGSTAGNLEYGELAVEENNERKFQLPLSLFSRWSA
jgi:hypothetical protein